MAKEINIIIENKLEMERRDISVYHHAARSIHMISFNSSVTIPLKLAVEGDYLHISVPGGPGPLVEKCMVNLPSWIDFEFSPGADVTVTHAGNRTILKIAPGPPTWQLKMTWSPYSPIKQSSDFIAVAEGTQRTK